MTIHTLLAIGLGVVALIIVALVRAIPRHRLMPEPIAAIIAIGFITNFFDTLGIGSFAPTTSFFKSCASFPTNGYPERSTWGTRFRRSSRRRSTSPSSPSSRRRCSSDSRGGRGAWLGAGVVARLPRRYVQIGMGAFLLAAAALSHE